jgi:hypothetical protein
MSSRRKTCTFDFYLNVILKLTKVMVYRPAGMSDEKAAVIVLYTMELNPREASLNVLTNLALRNHQSGAADEENIKCFGAFVFSWWSP